MRRLLNSGRMTEKILAENLSVLLIAMLSLSLYGHASAGLVASESLVFGWYV